MPQLVVLGCMIYGDWITQGVLEVVMDFYVQWS
jgi:hypothetical protein